MKILTKLFLMVLTTIIYTTSANAAHEVYGKTGEILTFSIQDYSETGRKLYNDILSGENYVKKYKWTCSGECSYRAQENTFAYIVFNKPGTYTVKLELEYTFLGSSRSYSFNGTWEANVSPSGPTSITVTADNLSIKVGNKTTCYANLSGGSGSVNWKKSNDNVDIFSYGTECSVSAVKPGTVRISASTNNGLSDYIDLKINEDYTIDLNPTSLTLKKGETSVISGTVKGTDPPTPSWRVSDSKILRVNDSGSFCTVTGLEEGSAYVSCCLDDGTEARCSVSVLPADILISEILIEGGDLIVKVGKKINLSTEILPTDATNKNLYWSSSNSDICSVSSTGVITTKKQGWCIISCESEDLSGCSDSIIVTVVEGEQFNDYTSVSLISDEEKYDFVTSDNENYFLHLIDLPESFIIATNNETLTYGIGAEDHILDLNSTIMLEHNSVSPIMISTKYPYACLNFKRSSRELTLSPFIDLEKEYVNVFVASESDCLITHLVEKGSSYQFSIKSVSDVSQDAVQVYIADFDFNFIPILYTEDRQNCFTPPLMSDVIMMTIISVDRENNIQKSAKLSLGEHGLTITNVEGGTEFVIINSKGEPIYNNISSGEDNEYVYPLTLGEQFILLLSNGQKYKINL